jgi:hypothetical protein
MLTSMDAKEEWPDFDWSPLGRGWWAEKAKDTGADERQLRFACLRHRGCSQAESARQAGYPDDGEGSVRQAGWRAARTRVVTTLCALAVAEAKGGVEGCVDAAEARRILTRLARGSDPSIKIRALEAIAKLDATDLDREQAERANNFDPLFTLDELSKIDPLLAQWLARSHGLSWKLPPSCVGKALANLEKVRNWILEAEALPVANGVRTEAQENVAA